MSDSDDNYMSIEDLEAHEKFMEEIRQAEPTRSCDMVRAWMKLNIQSAFTDISKN